MELYKGVSGKDDRGSILGLWSDLFPAARQRERTELTEKLGFNDFRKFWKSLLFVTKLCRVGISGCVRIRAEVAYPDTSVDL